MSKNNHTSIAPGGSGRSFKREKYKLQTNMWLKSRSWQLWFIKHFFKWGQQSWHLLALSQRATKLHLTPSSRWCLPRCHRSVRNDMRLFLRTKHYPVQLRTTEFWKRLTQYYSLLHSTAQYYKKLQSTTKKKSSTSSYFSSTTKY